MKILYVENHAVFADTVTRKFLPNHSVTIAPSLAEARQALAKGRFDLLLIDFDLDDGKGDALAKVVRDKDPHITIIGVSSHEEGNAILRRASANAICSKMQFDQIQSVIDRAMRREASS